jgi:hypothetical protein
MHMPRSARSARPTRALAAILVAVCLAVAGCGGAADSGGAAPAKAAAGSAADGADTADGRGTAPGAGPAATGTPRLPRSAIIRTATLTLQVEDVAKALDRAREAAEEAGGYPGEESTNRDRAGHERTRVVLRVPAAAYDTVLAELQGAGRLIRRTARAVDVTDQVVDVDSRVKSQRASVDRIRALMARADKLSDVVALEGELSSRQADLEALLARQASLKDRTSLATITLSLSGAPAHTAAGDGTPGIADAVAGGWHVCVTLLRWILLALGAVLPFAAFAALLSLLWLRAVRPRLPRRREPAPAMTALGPLPSARPAPESSGERAERE